MEDLPTLQSLADESPRGTKPVYSWLTLTKCAIAGSPNKTLTAEEVIAAIQERFIFFTYERAGDWKTYIINTLSNTPCFSPTGTGVFSPDELYWEYDFTLDKDRENAIISYVPSPGPSTRSGSVGPFGSSAAGGSGASTPQHGNGSGSSPGGNGLGAQGSRPAFPGRERSSRRRRHEDRERRRHRGRTTETREMDRNASRDRGEGGGRERERRRNRHQDSHERARTREREAPPSREGPRQAAIAPRPRTKSNPTRPPPLNFGSSSNLRSNTAPNPLPAVAQTQSEQNQYRTVLQYAQNDRQELLMPPRLGRERDPDTGSLRSYRSFRSLIDAAMGGANASRDKGKAKNQSEQPGSPATVALPSSSEPQTDQQRRKMEKEQEEARKKMEKQQQKETEALRRAEEKARERVTKADRERLKATGLADKLKTIGLRGPSHSGSNASSISGHVYPSEPSSAVHSYSQAAYSGPGGRGTPQPVGVAQQNVPFILDLLESATSEAPPTVIPMPPKNGQDGTLKKAKSFLLFWKG